MIVTYNMHGNEPLGARVVELLRGNERITPVDLHPEAAAQGVRHLTDAGELGSIIPYYGDSPNPDSHAAALATKVLEAFPTSTRMVDIHCMATPNNDFAFLGNLVPIQSLAVARLVGRTIIQQFPQYPFFENFYNILSIESTTRTEAEMEDQALYLAARLSEVAMMDDANLRDYLYDTGGTEGFKFYKRFKDIMLVMPNGQPNLPVLNVLEELEDVEVSGAYSPVSISPRIAEALDIIPGQYIVNTWGYANMSSMLDDGVRRRCFGDLLCEVAPPVRIGKTDFLYFGYAP